MRRFFLFLLCLVAAASVRADIVSFPISSDFDAEFARAVDLIEAGQRAQAESVLAQIQTRSGQPAWKARIEMLLASADEQSGHFEDASRHLTAAPAAAIGLEPYRRLRLGQALARCGRLEEAERELWRAFETDEPFAMRAEAGWELAGVLEKRRHPAEALRVLTRAASLGPAERAATIGAERIRLARALGDQAAMRAAARDLLTAGLDAPASSGARRVVADELARATPAERARFGRTRISAGDIRRGVELLKLDSPSKWPPAERATNLLALARGLEREGDLRGAQRVAASIPADGTEASFEAELLRADLALKRLRQRHPEPKTPAADSALLSVRRTLETLASGGAPVALRAAARERLIRLAAEGDLFEEGLAQARRIVGETPGTTAGFEPLWKLAWSTYLAGDFTPARGEFAALAALYHGAWIGRRLSYWTARCLEREGRPGEAAPIYRELAAADPADLYALFARRRIASFVAQRSPAVSDPSVVTAEFRRTDELLRLRFFSEAAAEALALPSSRGRDRRLAQAEFALGRFPAAAAAAKRAFPEMGTANEGGVPDAWRRLFYPIEERGFLSARAGEFGLDPSVLRALVRQESLFEARARSRAGALGLTQLMPATARSLSRSVLRQRYRRAFLYDPNINARLGAAYLKNLLDRFGGNSTYALAAYNGGPSRMARILRENPNRPEDEIFESHPAYETRDYVRHVLLFAESYRELYP